MTVLRSEKNCESSCVVVTVYHRTAVGVEYLGFVARKCLQFSTELIFKSKEHADVRIEDCRFQKCCVHE